MAEFHFVEDYSKHVASMLAQFPVDVAMRLAIGGNFDRVGELCVKSLIAGGVKSGMDVLDFGCGSGRVALPLSNTLKLSSYLGLDVVPELLQYASKICPPDYNFLLNQSLDIPVETDSLDAVFAFSVFTHLLQTEIAIYQTHIFNKLRKNGIFIYSFLEIDKHWDTFHKSALAHYQHQKPFPHLNMFLDRRQVEFLASRSGFTFDRYIEPDDPEGCGQTTVILRKL